MEAGGIEKTGSLRQIKLVRDGRSTQIDLYALLLYGSTHIDIQLRDGDRIIIPSIGPTLAISGEVKRPGIYEILPTVRGMHHQPENAANASPSMKCLSLAAASSPRAKTVLSSSVSPRWSGNRGRYRRSFQTDLQRRLYSHDLQRQRKARRNH